MLILFQNEYIKVLPTYVLSNKSAIYGKNALLIIVKYSIG